MWTRPRSSSLVPSVACCRSCARVTAAASPRTDTELAGLGRTFALSAAQPPKRCHTCSSARLPLRIWRRGTYGWHLSKPPSTWRGCWSSLSCHHCRSWRTLSSRHEHPGCWLPYPSPLSSTHFDPIFTSPCHCHLTLRPPRLHLIIHCSAINQPLHSPLRLRESPPAANQQQQQQQICYILQHIRREFRAKL